MKIGKGMVYLVGAGPGDPSLITVGAVSALEKAEVVLYDRLVNPVLLQHAPGARHIFVGKRSYHTPFNEQERIERMLLALARKGLTVVRLKGGDPLIFGRGGEEAVVLKKAGIAFKIIPGISAALAVPGSENIPLTHRGVSSAFGVFTGHEAGDGSSAGVDWETAARMPTAVFLMGLRRLPVIAARLIQFGRSAGTPAAVIERGTLPGQRVFRGTLSNISEKAAEAQSPALIVVGEVVRLGEFLSLPEGRVGEIPVPARKSPEEKNLRTGSLG